MCWCSCIKVKTLNQCRPDLELVVSAILLILVLSWVHTHTHTLNQQLSVADLCADFQFSVQLYFLVVYSEVSYILKVQCHCSFPGLTSTARSACDAPPIILGTKLLWPGASKMVKCFLSVSKYARPTSTVLPLSLSSWLVSKAQDRYLKIV